MAAQLITLPFRPVINLQGGIEPGALLDVYLSGTTTRVQLYANAAFTSNLTNPVVADGLGAFPAVYFDDSVPIRVVVRSAAGGDPLTDKDPYITDYADVEAAADAAAASAAAALVSKTNAETAVTNAAAQVDLAEAAAVVAQAFTGPLYANTTLGLAATTSGQSFAVDNTNGSAGVYLNNSGSAVLTRTIIIDPAASGTAALIGTTGGTLQSVLNTLGGVTLVNLATGVTGVLPRANGGVGSSDNATARTNLGAAASGANADITSLRRSTTIAATGTAAANSIGFLGVPLSSKTQGSNITPDLEDIGALLMNTTGGWTIPPNASVNFPLRVGFAGYNDSASNQTITPGSGVTLRLPGTATTGARTVLQRGMWTAIQIKTNEWLIGGDVT